MKKWFKIVGLLIIIILIGFIVITLHGHGQRNYETCVRLGSNDVIDNNYHDAVNYFQGATKVDPHGMIARDDLDQTQSYVSGNHYFNQHRLVQASKNYHRAIRINAISALNRRSSLAYKRVKLIRVSSRQFKVLYDHALELNHRGDFNRSNKRLEKIMNDPNVKLTYFKAFKSRIAELIKSNNHNNHSDLVTSNVGPDRNKSGQFKLKTTRTSAKYLPKITITKARRQIKHAGIDVNEMSNSDVTNLIHQANEHHATIYRYAKDNY